MRNWVNLASLCCLLRPFKWSCSPLIRFEPTFMRSFCSLSNASFIHPPEGLYFLFDLQWRMYTNILFHRMVWTYKHSSHRGKIIDIHIWLLTRVHFFAPIRLLRTICKVNFLANPKADSRFSKPKSTIKNREYSTASIKEFRIEYAHIFEIWKMEFTNQNLSFLLFLRPELTVQTIFAALRHSLHQHDLKVEIPKLQWKLCMEIKTPYTTAPTRKKNGIQLHELSAFVRQH